MAAPAPSAEARPAKRRCFPLPRETPVSSEDETRKTLQHDTLGCLPRSSSGQPELAAASAASQVGHLSSAALLQLVQTQSAGGVPQAVLRNLFSSIHRNPKPLPANALAATPNSSLYASLTSLSSAAALPGAGPAYSQAPSPASADLLQSEQFGSAAKNPSPNEASPILALLGEATRAATTPRTVPALSAVCPAASSGVSLPPASDTLALAQSSLSSSTGCASDVKASRPEEHPAFASGTANRQSLLQALLLSTAPLAFSGPSLSSASTTLPASSGAVSSRNAGAYQFERLLQAEAAKVKALLPNTTSKSMSQSSVPQRDLTRKTSLFPDPRGLSADDASRRYNTRGANSGGAGLRRGTGVHATTEQSGALDAGERTRPFGAGEDESAQGKPDSRGRQRPGALDASNILGLLAAFQPSQAPAIRDLSAPSHLSAAATGALPLTASFTASALASSQCLPAGTPASSSASPPFSEVLSTTEESSTTKETDASASTLLAFLQKYSAVSGLGGASDFLGQLQGKTSLPPLSLAEPSSALPSSFLGGSDGGTIGTRNGNGEKTTPPIHLFQSAFRMPSPSQQNLLDALLASSCTTATSRSDGSGNLGCPVVDERNAKLAGPAHPLPCSFPQISSSSGEPGRKTGGRVHRQGTSQSGGRVRSGKNGGSAAPPRQSSSDNVPSTPTVSSHEAPHRAGFPSQTPYELSASPSHQLDLLRLGAFLGGAGKQDASVHSDETGTLSGEPSHRSCSLSRGLTQESVLQLSDTTSTSREGEPNEPSQGCVNVAASLPAFGPQPSSGAAKAREGRRGAGGAGAAPPVPLRADVTLGGNRPHYHVAKQEWRVRYYMNGKRKMRTYSAKFYGYETAHTMAEDFAHYVDKHEALPDSMMMTAMMLQAQANSAASSGQTVPLARGIRASSASTGAGGHVSKSATKGSVAASSEGSTSMGSDATRSQEGEAAELCPLAAGLSRPLASMHSAAGNAVAQGRQESKEEAPGGQAWFGEPGKFRASSEAALCGSGSSAEGRDGHESEVLWATLGKVHDASQGKKIKPEKPLTVARGRLALGAEDKSQNLGVDLVDSGEAQGLPGVRQPRQMKNSEECSLRDSDKGMALSKRFGFLPSQTPSCDSMTLPFPGGFDALSLSSALSSCASLPVAHEGNNFQKGHTGDIVALASQSGTQRPASVVLSRDANVSGSSPSHPTWQREGAAVSGRADEFSSLSVTPSTVPLSSFTMEDIKGEEGDPSRRFALVGESMKKVSAPEVQALFPTSSIANAELLPVDFLHSNSCSADKLESSIPRGLAGNNPSMTATAVAATAVSHQIFDTITLFGEFLREFAKEKVNEFHEYGLEASPLTVEASPEVSLFGKATFGRCPVAGGSTPAGISKMSGETLSGLSASELSLVSARTNTTTGEEQFALARGLFPGDSEGDRDEKKPQLSQQELLVLSHALVNLTSSTYVLMHTLKASLSKSTEAVQLHQPLLEAASEAKATDEAKTREEQESSECDHEYPPRSSLEATTGALPFRLSPALSASSKDLPSLSASASLESVTPFAGLPLEEGALSASVGLASSDDEHDTSLLFKTEAAKKRSLFSTAADGDESRTYNDGLGQPMEEEIRSCVSTSCGEAVATTTLSAIGPGTGASGALLDSESRESLGEKPGAALRAGAHTPAPSRAPTPSRTFSFTSSSTATSAALLCDSNVVHEKLSAQGKDSEAGERKGDSEKEEEVEMWKEEDEEVQRCTGSAETDSTEATRGEEAWRRGKQSEKKPSVITTALNLLETHRHLALTISQLKRPVAQQLRFILPIAAPQLLPCILPPASFQGPGESGDGKAEAEAKGSSSLGQVLETALGHGTRLAPSASAMVPPRKDEAASAVPEAKTFTGLANAGVMREAASRTLEAEQVSRKRSREEVVDSETAGDEGDMENVPETLDATTSPGSRQYDKSPSNGGTKPPATAKSRVIRDQAALERLLLAPFQDTPTCSCTDRPCPCDRQQVADMIYLFYAVPARQQAESSKEGSTQRLQFAARDTNERKDARTGEETQGGETEAKEVIRDPEERGVCEGSSSQNAHTQFDAETASSSMSSDPRADKESNAQDAHMADKTSFVSDLPQPSGEFAPSLLSETSLDVAMADSRGTTSEIHGFFTRSDEQKRASFSSSSLLAAGHAVASFSSSLAGVVSGAGERRECAGPSLGDLSTIGLLSLSYPAMLAFILPLQSLLHTVSGMILTLHKKLIHRFICAHLRLVLDDDMRRPAGGALKSRGAHGDTEAAEAQVERRRREHEREETTNLAIGYREGNAEAANTFPLVDTVSSLLSPGSLRQENSEVERRDNDEERLELITGIARESPKPSEKDSVSPFLSTAPCPGTEAESSDCSASSACSGTPTEGTEGGETGDIASFLSPSGDVKQTIMLA
uniref:AP2 domain transcription factor AP2IV-4 n=1 Tax=Toxoplasma gondii COUG TaxID=1074873 RepID=A0A2G8XR57_TOXGO|nr:AP2 domain transcription factor AP2IV-4 [Toxoplasma gondii COUG]